MSTNTVMVCATEVGSAVNLTEIVLQTSAELEYLVYSKNAAAGVFTESGINVVECSFIDSLDLAKGELTRMRPDAVLCGRAIDRNSADRYFVAAARMLAIPSISIIDEWYDYRENYTDLYDELEYFPDAVCCPDNQAKSEAIGEGLTESQLYVTGSPAYSSFFDKLSTFNDQQPTRPSVLRWPVSHPIITFISEHVEDVHSQIYFNKIGSVRTPVYDEEKVKMDLVSALTMCGKSCTVLEKIHPSSEVTNQTNVSNGPSINWHVIREGRATSYMWHSDLVIGIRSAALIEAALMGKPTVSYQPSLSGPDRCTAARKKMIASFTKHNELVDWLMHNWAMPREIHIERPEFAQKGAPDKVLSVIQQKISEFSRRN